MEFREYVTVVRSHWRVTLLVFLVCVGLSSALTISTPRFYQASTQLFIATQSSQSNADSAYQSALFSQQRVRSYLEVLTSPDVLEPVIFSLGLSTTPSALAGAVSASAPSGTVLMNIFVTSRDPARAEAVANAVSIEFAKYVGLLETPNGGGVAPVKVTISKPALLPHSPISPRVGLNIGLGIVMGLFLGFALAFVRSVFDTTIKSPNDIDDLLEVPTLGVIPYDGDARKNPMFGDSRNSIRAEAFRQLRTNLQYVGVDAAPRVVVISSSVPDEGKSTTAANLAMALARTGMRVCLVEGDLRRPRLQKYLDLPKIANGLADVIIGKAELDDVLIHYPAGPYEVLVTGSLPPNPSELLASAAMENIVRTLAAAFDVVLIDAPPLLPVTDAAILSTVADGVLFVVRANSTKREQMLRALDLLRVVDTKVLGIVLNMAKKDQLDTYPYGSYSKSHRRSRREPDASVELQMEGLVPATRRPVGMPASEAEEDTRRDPGGAESRPPVPTPSQLRAWARASKQTDRESIGAAILEAMKRGKDAGGNGGSPNA